MSFDWTDPKPPFPRGTLRIGCIQQAIRSIHGLPVPDPPPLSDDELRLLLETALGDPNA